MRALLLLSLLLVPATAAATTAPDAALTLPAGEASADLCHGRVDFCSAAPGAAQPVLYLLVRYVCSRVACPA